MAELLYLEWVRFEDGFTIEDLPNRDAGSPVHDLTGSPVNDSPGAYLCPRWSDNVEKVVYRPLEQYPALFREFADTETSPEGVLQFVKKYGHTETYSYHDYTQDGRHLYYLYAAIEDMREAIQIWERGDLKELVRYMVIPPELTIKFRIIPGREKPALVIEPKTLLDGMWIQFAQAVTGDTNLQKCSVCPTWFVYGSGTGRRSSSLYCSERCRKAAYEQRKQRRRAKR